MDEFMTDVFSFIVNIGLVAKLVLVFLVILSIISWAIILEKGWQFRKIKKETKKFLQAFQISPGLNEMYQYTRDFRHSPFAWMVKALFNEFNHLNRNNTEREEVAFTSGNPTQVRRNISSLNTVLKVSHSHGISRMEQRLIILSTTVSVSPFLGLLGTVWGIMNAFLSIGITGSADLASVGPGIAEALVTTAAGLAVAIPALIAYNYFVDTVRQMDDKLDTFATEMLLRIERESAV
jgi:biopolymer transport protein TolQ